MFSSSSVADELKFLPNCRLCNLPSVLWISEVRHCNVSLVNKLYFCRLNNE